MYCDHFLSLILVHIFIYFTFNSTIMDMKFEHYTSIIKSVIHLIAFSGKSAQILPEILHNKKLMQKKKNLLIYTTTKIIFCYLLF